MKPKGETRLRYVLLLMLSLMITLTGMGCAQWKPYKPPVSSEIPEGPGVLSGEDGEFVIYRKKSEKNEVEK